MLFKLSNLNSNIALTLAWVIYLNPALNNAAQYNIQAQRYKLKLLISLIQLVETEGIRILSSFMFSRWGIYHQGSHLPWPCIYNCGAHWKLNYMYGWLNMLLFFLLFLSVSCKSLRNSIMLNLPLFLIGIKSLGEFISVRKQQHADHLWFPPKMISLI